MKKLDLLGKKFGRLTVIESIYGGWRCLCDCGKETKSPSCHLTNGNKKSCGCLINLPFGESARNHLYGNYRDRSVRKKLEFNLTIEQFENLTKQHCHYCNSEPKQVFKKKKHKGYYIYNGIDRVDNNIGYTLENSVPCCGICNKAKRDLSKEVFEKWIANLINFYKVKTE